MVTGLANEADAIQSAAFLDQTARIVSAYASSVTLSPRQLTDVIMAVSAALTRFADADAEPERKELVPAVAVRKSVTADFIICLEDGKKLKMLKRHLMTTYAMTPADYRRKWGLPFDYPMVAPNYAAVRSQIAKTVGLGRTAKNPLLAAATRRDRPADLAA